MGYHIIAEPLSEGGYTVTVPESPGYSSSCPDESGILETGVRLHSAALSDAAESAGAVCPVCGARYTEPPALSRRDNSTPICPACGVREALAAWGCSEEMTQDILSTIEKVEP